VGILKDALRNYILSSTTEVSRTDIRLPGFTKISQTWPAAPRLDATTACSSSYAIRLSDAGANPEDHQLFERRWNVKETRAVLGAAKTTNRACRSRHYLPSTLSYLLVQEKRTEYFDWLMGSEPSDCPTADAEGGRRLFSSQHHWSHARGAVAQVLEICPREAKKGSVVTNFGSDVEGRC
jgi:hypothetical protein